MTDLTDKELADAVEDILDTNMSHRLKVKSIEAVMALREPDDVLADWERELLTDDKPTPEQDDYVGWVPSEALDDVLADFRRFGLGAAADLLSAAMAGHAELLPHKPV